MDDYFLAAPAQPMTKEKRCLVYSAAHNANTSAHVVKAAAKLEVGSNVQWRLTQAGCGLGISIGSAEWHVVWQANLQAGGRSLLRIGGPVSLGSTLSISGQFGVTWPRTAIPKCLKVPRGTDPRCIDHLMRSARGQKLGQ